MGKIHEHLAALNEIENQDKAMSEETRKTFGKRELFEGHDRILHMHDEKRKAEEAGAGDSQTLTTTVIERLYYENKFSIKNLDMQLQREVANTKAKATIELPGGAKIENVPVTFLMYFEKYLIQKRKTYLSIPTLDTTMKWEPADKEKLQGVHQTVKPESTNKTEKDRVVIVKFEATDKHPAQTELFDKDIIVGHYEKACKTGKFTPAQKHKLISYIDGCIVAVKRAKARANETIVEKEKIGKSLFDEMMKVVLEK